MSLLKEKLDSVGNLYLTKFQDRLLTEIYVRKKFQKLLAEQEQQLEKTCKGLKDLLVQSLGVFCTIAYRSEDRKIQIVLVTDVVQLYANSHGEIMVNLEVKVSNDILSSRKVQIPLETFLNAQVITV